MSLGELVRNWPEITASLLTIPAMPHATCDARLWPYLKDTTDYVLWAATAALLKHCNPHEVAARAPQDLRVRAEGAEGSSRLRHETNVEWWEDQPKAALRIWRVCLTTTA
jgi:hypothetical protein